MNHSVCQGRLEGRRGNCWAGPRAEQQLTPQGLVWGGHNRNRRDLPLGLLNFWANCRDILEQFLSGYIARSGVTLLCMLLYLVF